eukprot:gene6602-8171_t
MNKNKVDVLIATLADILIKDSHLNYSSKYLKSTFIILEDLLKYRYIRGSIADVIESLLAHAKAANTWTQPEKKESNLIFCVMEQAILGILLSLLMKHYNLEDMEIHQRSTSPQEIKKIKKDPLLFGQKKVDPEIQPTLDNDYNEEEEEEEVQKFSYPKSPFTPTTTAKSTINFISPSTIERKKRELEQKTHRFHFDLSNNLVNNLLDRKEIYEKVGGGIVGSATAREILKRNPNLKVIILEKENEFAKHQSNRNSGVIHAGVYYKPGSVRAKLCKIGSEMMYNYCREKNIPYDKCGKVIVAVTKSECDRLDELYQRGITNGCQVEMIDRNRLLEIEPHIKGGLKAVYSPNTGIINFREVVGSMVRDISELGGEIRTGFEASEFDYSEKDRLVHVKPKDGGEAISTRFLITCCGLYSDRVSRLAFGTEEPSIVPFRGSFIRLKPEYQHLINGNVYPVPHPGFPFLGFHFTKKLNGDVWIGPNAVLAFHREGYTYKDFNLKDMMETLSNPGFIKLSSKYCKYGLGELYKDIWPKNFLPFLKLYMPDITVDHLDFKPISGVRAQGLSNNGELIEDFIFDEPSNKPILNVRNSPSPAATSSLAIAQEIDLQHQLQQQQQQQATKDEKKSRRNSIFVRFLNKKKNDNDQSISEDDFQQQYSSLSAIPTHNNNSNNENHPSFISAPNLTTSYSYGQKPPPKSNNTIDNSSNLSVSTNNNQSFKPYHHTVVERSVSTMAITTTGNNHSENQQLHQQLSEVKNQLSLLKDRELEWKNEREELIKKIQAMSALSTTPSSNSNNNNNINNNSNHTMENNQNINNRHELYHSASSPQLQTSSSSSTNIQNSFQPLSSQQQQPQKYQQSPPQESNINDDFSIYNDNINLELQLAHQNHQTPPKHNSSSSSISSSPPPTPVFNNQIQQPSLSASSSSVNFTVPNSAGASSPPLKHKARSRNRYTVAIPKWEASMNFNGTPFERLVNALRNSTDLFPTASNLQDDSLSSSRYQLLSSQNNNSFIPISPPPSSSINNNLIPPSSINHHHSTTTQSPSINNTNTTSNNQINNTTKTIESSPQQQPKTTDKQSTSTSTTTIDTKEPIPQSILDSIEEDRQKKEILTICLKKLMSKLIEENTDDSAFSKTFFATYECIFTANEEFVAEIRCVVDKNSYNYQKMLEISNQITYLIETKVNERALPLYSSTWDFEEIESHFLQRKAIMKIKAFLSTSLKLTSINANSNSNKEYNFRDDVSTSSSNLNDYSPPPSPKNHHRLSINSNGGVSGNYTLSSSTLDSTHLEVPSSSASNFDFSTIGSGIGGAGRPRSMTWSASDLFFSIMDAPAKEIAKALTAVDYSIFICIETQEFMNGAWGKPNMKSKAPNITKMISRFNEISMNVIQSILNEEKLKDRCKVMARFIKIAKHLHQLRNYNSLMAIYAGISHSSIIRLKWTRKILPKTHQKTLQDLEKLMESDENFKNYRNELKTITTPCIPFLGLVLSDMTFIQDGNPDFIGVDVNSWNINVTKLKLIYNSIKQIQLFQKIPYLLNADPRLTLILTPNSNIFGEPISTDPSFYNDNNNTPTTTTTTTTINNQPQQNTSTATNNNTSTNLSNSFGENDDKKKQQVNNTSNPNTNGTTSLESSTSSSSSISDHDRLYRSFTLEEKSNTNRRSYSPYNTWSPKKNEMKLSRELLKNSSGTIEDLNTTPTTTRKSPLLVLERSQSETFLSHNSNNNSNNNKSNINSQIVDYLVHNSSDRSNLLHSPRGINNQQQSNFPTPATDNEDELIVVPKLSISPPLSPSVVAGNKVTFSPSSASPMIGSTSPLIGTSSTSSLPMISLTEAPSSSSPPSLSTSSSTNHLPTVFEVNDPTSNDGVLQISVKPIQRKSNRRKSVSTSNIFSGLLQNSIKGSSTTRQQAQSHTFTPMTDEGLFSLSLKLEPRGVKLSDLS